MRRKLLQRQGAELGRRAPLNGFLLSHSLYADSLKASSVFLNEFQADLEARERKCGPEEAVGREGMETGQAGLPISWSL